MIPSLSSKVFRLRNLVYSSRTNFSLRFDFTPISQTKHFSSIDVDKDDSFTVSYFINSCGLSSASAKLVSKHVQLKDASNPDSVLDFFRNYGFSDAHIKKAIRGYPTVLLLNAENNLKPKMEFFSSIGVKGEDLVAIICLNPCLLGCSLNERIIPCYDFLKRVLVHDELVVKSLKHNSYVWSENLEYNVIPNFQLLKKLGVPKCNYQYVLTYWPGLLRLDNAEFSERVNRVISLGFEPSKYSFLQATRGWPTESTWERKAQVFRSWGWSDSAISIAFRKNPNIMNASVEKITAIMDFLVNKMGWDPLVVATAPSLFNYSFKKNIIPKCSVIRVLKLKGLIREKYFLYSFMVMTEKRFLDRYVLKYLEQVPELLKIYQGEVDLSELK